MTPSNVIPPFPQKRAPPEWDGADCAARVCRAIAKIEKENLIFTLTRC